MTSLCDRRLFLKAVGTGGANLAAGALGLGAWMRRAQAAHDPGHTAPGCGLWGDLVGNVGSWNCGNHAGYKILEIYLYAGASQWETFWLPGNASAPNFNDYDMGSPNTAPHPGGNAANSPDTLDLSQLNWASNTGNFPCEAPDIPPSSSNNALFGSQSGGGNIYWGAPGRPIFRRNAADDIFSRCRMVTQYHELAPHDAAIPFCLTGLTLGNPRLAGAGAPIQRRARVLDPNQELPASYILYRGASLAIPSATAVGTHPGFSRPLVIQVQNNNNFVNNLSRTGITAESDDLLLALRHEFRDRMRFRGAGDPVRSQGFQGYWVAAELLKDAPDLQALFQNELLVIDGNVTVCPTHPAANVGTAPSAKTMLHAAASLLSTGPARYVGVLESGVTGNYDTHGDGSQRHLLQTSANLYNVMHHLADIIHHPSANPTGTLDLDDTMVVITSEFGRTPWINGDNGRDHWPWGYVSTFIGGPITSRSIRGSIDSGTAYADATHRYSPTDIRGAVLLAAGVDPFAEGNYRFSDFSEALKSGVATEADLRNRLRSQILGV